MVDKSRNKRSTDTVVHIKTTKDTADMFDYLMHSEGLTKKDLFAKMVELYISVRKNRYQLPDLTLVRLNQLITAVQTNTDDIQTLTKAVNNGFSTMLRLDDDGEE